MFAECIFLSGIFNAITVIKTANSSAFPAPPFARGNRREENARAKCWGYAVARWIGGGKMNLWAVCMCGADNFYWKKWASDFHCEDRSVFALCSWKDGSLSGSLQHRRVRWIVDLLVLSHQQSGRAPGTHVSIVWLLSASRNYSSHAAARDSF